MACCTKQRSSPFAVQAAGWVAPPGRWHSPYSRIERRRSPTIFVPWKRGHWAFGPEACRRRRASRGWLAGHCQTTFRPPGGPRSGNANGQSPRYFKVTCRDGGTQQRRPVVLEIKRLGYTGCHSPLQRFLVGWRRTNRELATRSEPPAEESRAIDPATGRQISPIAAPAFALTPWGMLIPHKRQRSPP